MTGLGMVVAYIGYCVVYWGIQAISLDQQQEPFMNYLFPWRQ